MFRVALTGGVASGKSTVARHFAQLGAAVLDADRVARELVEPGTPALHAIAAHFGHDVLDAGGRLDRAALRARILADPGERRWLEALLHPAIHRRLNELAQTAEGPYVVLEIPLLAESGRDWGQHRVLLVDAPVELQRARLIARDGVTAEQAEALIRAQADRAQRQRIADDILLNDGSERQLREAVESLHRRYLALAGATPL